jgi:hypothetical protein
MPTTWPSSRAEAGGELGREQRLQLEERVGVDQAVDDAMHVVAGSLLRGQFRAGEFTHGRLAFHRSRPLTPTLGQIAEQVAGLVDGVGVVVSQVVAAAADGGVHAGAAHLLQRHDLADDLLRHARRAEVHAGVALDHDHHVAERGDVGAARRRRAEQAADLRHLAAELHLVAEDAAGTTPPGEQLHLVGDARAGGVDEPEDGQLVPQRVLGDTHDLLHGARTPRAGLHRGVVGHHQRGAAVHPALAGDHAVGGQVGGQRVGQQAVLHERAGVEQQRQPVAHEQLALAGQLLALAVQVAGEGACTACLQVVVLVHVRHHPTGKPRPREMTSRWISLVPSPISRIFASR